MTTLHESADYSFRIICEGGWTDEDNGDQNSPCGLFYKLSVARSEIDDFLDAFTDVDGFEPELFLRVWKDGHHFIVVADSFGNWSVEQFPTFAERDQMWDNLSRQYDNYVATL